MYLFLFSTVFILSQFWAVACFDITYAAFCFLSHKRSHDVIFYPKKQKLHQANAPQLLFLENGILSLHNLSVMGEENTKQ